MSGQWKGLHVSIHLSGYGCETIIGEGAMRAAGIDPEEVRAIADRWYAFFRAEVKRTLGEPGDGQ